MNYVTVGDYIPVLNIVYLTYPNLLASLWRIFGSGGQTQPLNGLYSDNLSNRGNFPCTVVV